MNILCFVGLSISPEDARDKLTAKYFGPVSGGDIPAAIAEYHPKAIGIIDGLFHTRPAVLHKDILYALSLGVKVFGAASIGALRAAELHEFGMIGVGGIYERFATGELTGDDEVAVPCVFKRGKGWFVAEGYEPLVNIRATIENAVQLGVVTPEVALQVIDRAMSLCFMERHWDVILDVKHYGANALSLQLLHNSLSDLRVDIKKKDALALLETMQVWSKSEKALFQTEACSMPRGPFWDESLFSRPLTVPAFGEEQHTGIGEAPLLCDLLDYSISVDPSGSAIFQDALIRTLLLELGVSLGVEANKEDIEACKKRIYAAVNNVKTRLAPLNEIEIEALAADEVICEKLFDHYSQLTDRGVLLTLLAECRFEHLKEKLIHISRNHRSSREMHGLPIESKSREIIENHLSNAGVMDTKDYFERYVQWIPVHRRRFLGSLLTHCLPEDGSI